MKTRLTIVHFVCLLLLCLALQTGIAASQDVWISFAGTDTSNFTTPYMMKIDASGNVLIAPKQIVSSAKCPGQGCFPALTDGTDGNIVMMLARVVSDAKLARTIVNKATLHAGSVKNIGVTQFPNTFPGALQVTQHVVPKFIVVKTNTQTTRAFPLTSDGFLAGSSWRPNPRVTTGSMFQIGVAPDAAMSWGINLNSSNPPAKIYVQPLNSKGRPSGDPAVSASGNFITGVDITSLLSNSKRFLAYSEEGEIVGKRIVKLQVIDGMTGAKLGNANEIADTGLTGFIQNLALDPMGRFIVWNETSTCGQIVKFQALTSGGDSSGSPKTIVDCASFSVSASFLDSLLD